MSKDNLSNIVESADRAVKQAAQRSQPMTVNKEFEVHLLNEVGIAKAQRIAAIFDAALTELVANCPAGRELAIVRTKMEEASFFAKKAMANDPANQKGN